MAELLFKKVDYTIGKLLDDIYMGEIALPDIQRPFVWDMARVRDLFDSMYRGYPIGTLLFWENGRDEDYHPIGLDAKQKPPHLLIVDGQQRLTALYAVMKRKEIKDQKFRDRSLRIAFRPADARFEVTNAATERDPSWICDISVLWEPTFDQYAFVSEFLQGLSERGELPQEDRKRIPNAIQALVNLKSYPMTALEISAGASEEQVSEIFVRINSRGRTLNQADFILTLMSVFWDEGRRKLEDFAFRAKRPPADNHPSPYNLCFQPDADQLLRVDVAVAFRRASLEHVYSILRGKDLETGEFAAERRESQFALLRTTQEDVLDLQHWHDFLNVLKRAGYIHPSLVMSQSSMAYTYALWLIGKRDFRVDFRTLRDLMARWFFMSILTGRYTSSGESRMDQDLSLLRGRNSAQDFSQVLEQEMDSVLTPDYWQVSLPNHLATASPNNPGLMSYFAALCILDAAVLYSTMKVRDLLDHTARASKRALERHHLFPRAHLQAMGITDERDLGQVANYALVEWQDNGRISGRAPSEYVPEYERRFSQAELEEMYRMHALPRNWYLMEYQQFLEQRRSLMAAIVREGYDKLKS